MIKMDVLKVLRLKWNLNQHNSKFKIKDKLNNKMLRAENNLIIIRNMDVCICTPNHKKITPDFDLETIKNLNRFDN